MRQLVVKYVYVSILVTFDIHDQAEYWEFLIVVTRPTNSPYFLQFHNVTAIGCFFAISYALNHAIVSGREPSP